MRHLLLLLALAACQQETGMPSRLLGSGAAPSTTLQSLPNVVVFLTDDHRGDLGFNYMPLSKARLADSGVVFSKAHVNTPVCCPSRASYLTGLYQHNHQVWDNNPPYGAPSFVDTSTLATELQAAGYVTALIGKYMNGYDALGAANYVPPGWDEWRVFRDGAANYFNYWMVEKAWDSAGVSQRFYGTTNDNYSTHNIRLQARAFIQRVPDSLPLFLTIATKAPHNPITVQPQDIGSCNSYSFPVPANMNEADVSDKPEYVQAKPLLTSTQVADQTTKKRQQCEMLQAVDRAVRGVLMELSTENRLANSLIVLVGDNGFLWGEHRLTSRKHSVYGAATSVPLAIRWPGGRMAVTDTNLVQMVDLTATIRDVAGITGSSNNGRSLLPLLMAAGLWTDPVLIENMVVTPANEHFQAVRTHQYLYAEYPFGVVGGGAFVELYDLSVDPFELVNVAADTAYAAIRTALAAQLAALRIQ